jgi:DNA (cytosine-5)-methyltransferase 1
MRHGSLFSGIGGFDLAAEWMGWENVFHCEWMEFPRKVLEYHFPNADSHTDITKTDFKKYANTIDILTGGFPCQPFSTAGKRKGTDDERYLWHEMLRAIQEIKPQFVIAENVFGITNIDGGLVFEQVCLDLENEGYEVQPFIICAAAKNAPHRRDRCWFIAYTNGTKQRNNPGTNDSEKGEIWGHEESDVFGELCSNGDATDTTSVGLCGDSSTEQSQFKTFGTRNRMDTENAANTKCKGFQSGTDTRKIRNKKRIVETERNQSTNEFTTSTNEWDVAHTNLPGCETKRKQSKPTTQDKRIKYCGSRWQQFPTQSPICGGDDGIPTKLDGITFSKWRAESIKGYGNAIVPQVALELFKVIEEFKNILK